MNKPIRTISIFCLLLFLALMLNATYLQYCPRRRAQRRPAATGASSRGVLPRARRDPGRQRPGRARACQSDDAVQVPAHLPPAVQVRPAHRLLLLLRPDRHRALPERRALRRRLAAVRHPARRHAQQHRAQGRQRPADHRPRRRSSAAYDGLAGARRRTCRAPWSRSSRATGKVLAMVSLPDVRPQHAGLARLRRGRRDLPSSSTQDPAEPLHQPRRSRTTLPPGSTFKLVTAAAAIEKRRLRPPTRWCPAARRTSCPQSDDQGRQRGRRRLRRQPDHPDPGARRSPATSPSLPLADELGAEDMTEQAEEFGFNRDLPRGPRRPGPSRSTRPTGRAADRAVRASASST